MLKNIVQPDRPQMTIWRMRIPCRILVVANTYSQYILLLAFPPKQWFHERASVLRYTYIGCIVVQCISVYITPLLVVWTNGIGGAFLRLADTRHI
jgi:hypothetical protein